MNARVSAALSAALFAAILCSWAQGVRATVLVFQPATGAFGDFAALPQGYGSRVTATVQDGFLYGASGGPTPNVVVQHSTGGMAQLYTWSTQFGDLPNVVFALEPRVFEMRLVADPGFEVTLSSFDMAAWPHLDYTINSVSVLDGAGNLMYSESNVHIEGDATGPGHTHFDFGPGLRSGTLRIMYDSTNVDSDDVAIDNITFSQGSPCGSADFNCDGDIGTDTDIEAFFACLSGSCPPPPCRSTADFNSDGDIGTDADIEAFFRVLAGGNC